MPLFLTNEIDDYSSPQVKEASVTAIDTAESGIVLRLPNALDDRFPAQLQRHTAYHFATAGLWSSHDLLFWLLQKTGPARIWIATWSMTEEPVRMLVKGIDSGLIQQMRMLLDVRVKTRNPAVYSFVKMQVAKVSESICHAKVTVLENEDWAFTIVGSANYTNNPRIEAGVLTESRQIARFHRDWIDAEIENCKPFA